MKILVINRDPSLWTGGDAIQVENTIKALRELGHEVDFSSDCFTDPRGYDLVHVFHVNFFWTTPMMQECYLKKVPYIISAIYYDKEYDNSFGTMSKLLYRAKKVVALSNREKQEMVNRFGLSEDHIAVIPNGVDKSIFFDTDMKREGVISVGRLTDKAKGAEFVIKACYEMDVPCKYVGMSFNDENNIKLKAMCNHIENIDQQHLAQLYRQAKVYVCSSLSERQSLGVLEAKACGCNIVDSVHNRGADLLPSSVIVDPLDNEALKKAIKNQLLSSSQPDYVPSWLDVAKQIEKVYDKATNRRAKFLGLAY